MVLPTDLYRIQYQFDLGGDGEVAVTGFHARYDGADSVGVQANLLAEHALLSWKAGFDARVADFPSSVVLFKVNAYHVMPGPGASDGIGEFIAGSESGTSWAGTGADSLPWEVALVATLEAQPAGERVAHPRRYRGRMYLPPMVPGILAGTEGFVLNTKLPQLRDAVLNTLESFNDLVAGVQARAVVLSRTGGFATDVDHVSMDYQLDLQKRRQNRQSIPARSVSAALAA